MTNETAETAMRRACDFIVAGDLFSAMADLTQDAMADAMNLGASLTGSPLPESYEITSYEASGGDERFGVVFRAGVRQMRAHATWRQVDGAWKIVAIGIDSIT